MLHVIRERATGWIAYLIVFLISIPFALWGINEYFGGGSREEVASVDGEPIEFVEFQQVYQSNLRQRKPDPGQSMEDMQKELREQILDGLIQRRLIGNFLDAQHLDVTDAEVMQQIREMDVFQDPDHGGFDAERYQRLLQANRMTAAEFEYEQRQTMRTSIIDALLEASAFITDEAVRDYRTLQDQTRDFRYFEIPRARFMNTEAVTAEEIEARYQASLDAYTTPRLARVSYLEVKREAFEGESGEMDEGKVQSYYERQALEFMAPELRRVRQIFFKGEEAESAARTAYEALQEGADFAELARSESQDEISAQIGGEIGWVAQDDLAEDLSTMVFSMESGTVSQPLTASLGIYLLEVMEIKEASLRPLDEVRDQVIVKLRQEDRDRRYAAALSDLAELTYENPETLTVAAEQMDLQVQDLGVVDLDAPSDLLSETEVASYLQGSSEALQQGENSDRIDLSESWAIVLRLDHYEPPTILALEEVQEQIRENLALEAAQAALLSYASELTTRLHEQANFSDLATNEAAEIVTREAAPRRHAETSSEILERVFSLSRPRGEHPVFGMAVLPDGVAVIALDAVHEQTPDQVQDQDRQRLLYQSRVGEVEGLTDSLKLRATIETYPDRL